MELKINAGFFFFFILIWPGSVKQPEKTLLSSIFPNADAESLNLLSRLLQFNPEKRISAFNALKHPFVSHFHNPDEEPSCENEITICIDDNKKLSVSEYRDELYRHILKKKKEVRKKMKGKAKRARGLNRRHS